MTLPVIPTKLFIPPWRSNQVSRPNLLRQLEAGIGGKLTLISAPPGYGKSTLLSEWVHQAKIPLAWLSLDALDDHPSRFWAYFIAALEQIGFLDLAQIRGSLDELLQSPSVPDYQSLLANFVSVVAACHQRFVLILDDFHTITDSQIHDGLLYLLEHLPTGSSGMHLIISSRVDPPWPLARLRIRSELNELRSRDLRFTTLEVSSFLNQAMNLALSSDDVATLDIRTEGWVAGLQMAAISIRDRQDKAGFIHAFTGSHRYVLDFLLEEVLAQQSPEIRTFLLKTSLLERFNRDLCDVITAIPSARPLSIPAERIGSERVLHPGNSQAILDYLDKNNLFLIALDDQREWYRYHHLFADLLINLSRQNDPDGFNELHRTAANWFLQHADIPLAINHAFAAKDFEMAANIIEDNALTFIGNHALTNVIILLDQFSLTMLDSRPWLLLTRSWALAYLGERSAAGEHLNKLEPTLPSVTSIDMRKQIMGHAAAIRCFLSFHDAEFSMSAEYGYAALRDLAETDYQTRMLTASTLAAALLWDGKLSEASEVLRHVIPLAEQHSRDYTRVRFLCTLALIEMNLARFKHAIATLEKAMQQANPPENDAEKAVLPFTGQVYIRLADIYRRMNQPDLAMENLLKGIELAKKWGQAGTLWEGYHYLTLMLHARGEISASQKAWEQALIYAKRMSGKIYDDQTESIQAEIWLREGNFSALEKWLDDRDIHITDEAIHFSQITAYEFLVEVLLARGKATEALQVLAKTIKIAQSAGATAILIIEYIYFALAYHQLGQESQALQALSQSVLLAKDSGINTVFIQKCPPLTDLLHQVLSFGIADEFVTEILAGMNLAQSISPRYEIVRAHDLMDPLSVRELQVLRMLNTSLPVPEIAQELHLAPTTVRTHIQHIYRKLGVHSRIEVLQQARDLGLL